MAIISKMTFDNGSTKNLISSTFYGKCDTAAATAAKTVTIGGWDESVKDNVSGATVHIYFTNGNTAVASGNTYVTLNIDGCGAHQIITYADANVGAFSPGVYEFTFVPSNVPGDNSYRWLIGANALSAITADSAITAGTATSVPWSGVTGKPSLDFIPTSQKGVNSGVATLDANGKVPSGQLPSYVDDVLEYAARSLFPSTGTSGIIYVDTSTNLTYRWSGSDYVEISPSLALGTTHATAAYGDEGATAYAHATESGRLTTAASLGLYKISVTAQGHVGSATTVTKSDITALGIPGDSGVTSITIKGTSPITIDSESAITTTGTRTISLANSYGDTKNPYAAKVANTVLAGPASGNDAAPSFRQLVAADIPLLTKSKISDFPTSMPASDVSDWAKAATKPSYSLSEISGTDDLQEIESLTGTTGLLKKTAANTWTLDTTTYLASSAISDWAKASTKPSYSLSEIDGTQDLRKIEALADSSTGFLKKTAANTWALDSTTYATSSDISSAINALDGSVTGTAAASKTLTSFSQTNGVVTATFSNISITKSQVSDFPSSMPASDVSAWAKASTKPSYSLSEISGTSDLQEIEALTGTSGFLKKTAADTWSLDTTSYFPTTGGNVTGDITLLKQVASGAPGDSYGLIFQRGTLTDNYNDWMIVDSGGYLYFKERGSGSTAWTTRAIFNTTGNISATSFSGSGASLTSLNASNLSSGTVPEARLPDLSSTYIPVSEKGAASGVATLDSNSKVPIVQSNYLYGKCTTAGGTAAKTVTIEGYDEATIANMQGVTVFVGFNSPNTAASPTLNVSGSGAHAIVWGSLSDPMDVGNFSSGLHSFTLVKVGTTYYWYINEGRDTVPEAPTSTGTYILNISSNGATWHSITIPAAPTTGTLTLSASGWSGSGPYSHSVTISGTTANSKIDLQPDSTVLAQMTTDGTTSIYIENNNGTLTAWAMGAAPTASLTIQYTKTEVG